MLVAVSRKDLIYPITQCHEHVTCVHYVVCWISFSSSQLFIFCCQLTHRSVCYTHVVSAPSIYPVHNPLLLVFYHTKRDVYLGRHTQADVVDDSLSRGSIYRSTSVIPFDSAARWDRHTMYAAIAGLYYGVVYNSTLVIGARSDGIEVWPMTDLRSALSHCVYFGLQKLQKASDFATIFATSVAKWPKYTTAKTDIPRSWAWYIFIV